MALLEIREELSPGAVEIRKVVGRGIPHRKGRRGTLLVSRRFTSRTSYCGLEVTEDHSPQACTQAPKPLSQS